jgi:N-acetyl sugar amidotransferase
MKHYQLCKKTVMDTSDPGISFDIDGVCDHVYDFEKIVKPNWNPNDFGKDLLFKKVEEIKKAGRNNDFDCILGLSGGVDSSYLLHVAVKEFGLRPLVFHVDGGWNSELAVHNINVLVNKLDLDLYTEVINWEEMKDFQLAFFKSGVPHIDIPQDHAFIATIYNFADKYKIKHILNGGNISTECVQYPMQYYYYGTDMIHINDIRRKFGKSKMETYPFSPILRHKLYLKYFKRINVLKPLNFMPYLKNDAVKLLEFEYDWRPYPQKHFESRFTRFFEGYWLPERFGFDPRRVMLSSLILTDQMTRDQALDILKKPAYDLTTLEEDFKYIATKLDISTDELQSYFLMPKKFYWDYKNQQNLFRAGAKVLSWIGGENFKKRSK